MDDRIDEQDPILYTIEDIQRIFKIGRTSVYQLVNAPGFPSFRLNKKIYVPRDKLLVWINKMCGKTFDY